ncbi:glycosyltransferase family 39 protein [Pontibacter beigongshangensis]|uniref:glycosyltransferase family 39 protein n=1 Tax=Pontibacter beigongshangensis TaxID=2574733 RepID=UPI0016507DA5|nr:glycosyltransferase family 39 protein [Pontibacter beigongshangensis]
MFLYSSLTAPLLVSNHRNSASLQSDSGRQKLLLWLTLLIIAAGVFLRLYHFIDNRSLWRDELYLAVSLIRMDFWELATQPLAYEQKAPVGYLWAVKLLVVLFGKGEMALRLFSLLTGIATILLFVPVTRFFLKPWAALLALAMLAIGTPAVYHAVEAKQYGTELFASVLALYLFIRFHRQTDFVSLLQWGLAGATLLWFSYSAIFVLAGIASAVCLHLLLQKEWHKMFRYASSFTLWLISFAAVYVLYLGRYQDSAWLTVFFKQFYDAYMPLPPASATDFQWFLHKAGSLLTHPLGQTVTLPGPFSLLTGPLRLVPLITLVAGVVLLLRKNSLPCTVLAFPVLLTLIASGLKLYPFHERFVLFLAPMLLLFIAYGAQAISALLADRAAVKLPLILLLMAPPAWNAARQAGNTDLFPKKEANREALLYLNESYSAGDAVYIYWNMWHAYAYYKEAYNLKFTATGGKDLKTSSANQQTYFRKLSADFDNFQGHKRLWFLYHAHIKNNIGGFIGKPAWYFDKSFVPGQMLESAFSAYGEKTKQRFDVKETVVSLYQLSPEKAPD